MEEKNLQVYKKEIKSLFEAGDLPSALKYTKEVIRYIYGQKYYSDIVEIYNYSFIKDKIDLYIFEVAYSLAQNNKVREAEIIYQHLLFKEPKNSSVLNNLYVIKKNNGDLETAYDLISKAYKINKNDEIISRNYKDMSEIIEEQKLIDEQFKSAIVRLEKENDFVLEKLKNFISAVKSDVDYKKKDMEIPIASWKFKVLMKTDAQKADSLRDQWLDKGYIRRTGERGNYQEHIYKINPYIDGYLKKASLTKIPIVWIKGIENINGEKLDSLKYFHTIECLQKIRKKYRQILIRDFDELILNYIFMNYKSVVVISGSIVETLLMYYLEKKNIKLINYSRQDRNISRSLYEADLGDLLNYFEQQGMIKDIMVHMGNISRISRNFIHPGKELRETDELNEAKANLCFISTIEIMNSICNRAT